MAKFVSWHEMPQAEQAALLILQAKSDETSNSSFMYLNVIHRVECLNGVRPWAFQASEVSTLHASAKEAHEYASKFPIKCWKKIAHPVAIFVP